MLLAVLSQINSLLPTFQDVGTFGLIVSHAFVWDRLRRLEDRFNSQFKEIPKGEVHEYERNFDESRARDRRPVGR